MINIFCMCLSLLISGNMAVTENYDFLLDTKINMDKAIESTIEETITGEDWITYSSEPESIDYTLSDDTDDLSSSNAVTDEYNMVLNDSGTVGDFGRFYIPSVNINVAVYTFYDFYSAQCKCDEWDAAVLSAWHGPANVIADHSNQEFATLGQCKVGDRAYVKNSYGITQYECIEATTGYNLDTSLVRWDYVSFDDFTDCDIIAYTCNGNWQNIWVIRFKKINEWYF